MDNERLTIKQMADATGLSPHTLRYYERIGLIDPIERDTSSGHRRYAPADVERVEFLQRLRATGMPIRQMQQYTELMRQGNSTVEERRLILEAHLRNVEEDLHKTTQHLEAIKKKIRIYKERREKEEAQS